jgi:hypothetical protein
VQSNRKSYKEGEEVVEMEARVRIETINNPQQVPLSWSDRDNRMMDGWMARTPPASNN